MPDLTERVCSMCCPTPLPSCPHPMGPCKSPALVLAAGQEEQGCG